MIPVSELKSKLLTIDQAKEKLAITEGLSATAFEMDGTDEVKFDFPDDWNDHLANEDGLYLTAVTATLNGTSYSLTKDAVLEATSLVGLTKDFVSKTPGSLIEPAVNHWYCHGKRTLKLISGKGSGTLPSGLAFARGSVNLTSNAGLLDEALTSLDKRYGGEVLVDYKMNHGLRRTNLRLVVPEEQRKIASARALDEGSDPWSAGLSIENSVIGEVPLSVQGYMFAWWCTNGATTTHSASAKRRRKVNEDENAAIEWMAETVDSILEELEHEFDVLATLPSIPLQGDMAETAERVFEKYKVPVDAREMVLKNLADSADLTAYGMMNAITAAANDLDMNPLQVADLLRIGGEMPHAMAEMCSSCHRL